MSMERVSLSIGGDSESGYTVYLNFYGMVPSTGLEMRKKYTTKTQARKGARRLIKRLTGIDFSKVKII